MATYKVPQDVEAEDKLLGPFSFKQFIFLIIAVMMLAFAYLLFRILPPLAIIPLPIALFFGALALPLRKDQPMEVYLAAVISFLVKPKKRLWHADGIETLVEVTAPKVEEKPLGKGYDQEEVNRRLAYLANLVDTQGWAVRGVTNQNSSMQADLYHEAIGAVDVMGDSSTAGRIDSLIAQADTKRREEMMARMRQPSPASATTTPDVAAPYVAPVASITPSQPFTSAPQLQESAPTFNPYPTMQQSVIMPVSEQPATPPVPSPPSQQPAAHPPMTTPAQPSPTTPTQPSPAIIDLANNHSDLSIETLQREANRIRQREEQRMQEGEEVVISLH